MILEGLLPSEPRSLNHAIHALWETGSLGLPSNQLARCCCFYFIYVTESLGFGNDGSVDDGSYGGGCVRSGASFRGVGLAECVADKDNDHYNCLPACKR